MSVEKHWFHASSIIIDPGLSTGNHWSLHQDLWWNLLDVLCVFIGVVDFAAELLMLTVGMAAFAPLNTLTVIRVLRVVRIIRVVRAPRQILVSGRSF